MNAARVQLAVEAARVVVANVSRDELGASTPCASWDVGELVNHMVHRQTFFAVAAETGSAPQMAEVSDVLGGDFAGAFAAAAERTIAAFVGEGVLEKTITLRYGQVSGHDFATIVAIDTVTHGWDLARATGQVIEIAADVAGELVDGARSLLSGMRGAEGEAPYGLPVDVEESSAPVDRLAAYLGRRP